MASWTTQRSGNWSDDAANGTSPWNGGGNPASGVPASGDTVTIAGHTITFDVDQSGFASGLAGITMNSNSTLQASTNAGNYYLKMAGNIVGAASATGSQILAGSVGTPYPSNCTFTIYWNGNYHIDALNGITVKFYCYEPAQKYCRLVPTPNTTRVNKAITGVTSYNPLTLTVPSHGYSTDDVVRITGATGLTEIQDTTLKINSVPDSNTITLKWNESGIAIDASDNTVFTPYTSGGYLCITSHTSTNSGVTTLNVDRDVSADPEWTRSGATVYVTPGVRSSVSPAPTINTISSITSSTIVLTGGLSANRTVSSLVVLGTRNIRIRQSSTAITNGMLYRGSGHVLNAEWTMGGNNALVWATGSCTISGGIFWGGATTVSGVTGAFVNLTGNLIISGGVFIGALWSYCSYMFYSAPCTISGGLFTCCAEMFSGSTTGSTISDGEFYHNADVIYYTSWNGGTISGGKFVGNNSVVSGIGTSVTGGLFVGNAICYVGTSYGGRNMKISGGLYLNNNQMFSAGHLYDISNIKMIGHYYLNYYPTRGGTSTGAVNIVMRNSLVKHCVRPITNGKWRLYNCEFIGNTQEIYSDANGYVDIIGYRIRMSSGTKVTGYKQTNVPDGFQTVIYDRKPYGDDQMGYHGAWMPGGYVSTTDGSGGVIDGWVESAFLDSGNKPAAVSSAHVHNFEVAAYPVWLDIPIYGCKGVPVVFRVYWCKSANGMTATPTAAIMGPEQAFGDTPLASITMIDNTTWQTALLTYTPTYDQQLILRVSGRNATGSLQWQALQSHVPLGLLLSRM